MNRACRFVVPACLILFGRTLAQSPITPEDSIFFEKQIRPLLAEHCWSCHGDKKQQAALRLDSRQALLEGGENGPAIVSGKSDQSLLMKAVRHTDKLKMPPRQPQLPATAIASLKHWIDRGAPWPESSKATAPTPDPNKHWAFQPIGNPRPPTIRNSNWTLNDIDRFILAKLEEKGLSPAAEADRRTLIRRLTFDLIGLPPTPEEVDAFQKDESPRAYESLIDRLLASPHYGERWGRHWLDIARYADTKGYVFFEEANFPWGWTYRDYVIEALNADLPYDRFVMQQLAADLLPLGNDRRPLRALGFLTLGGRFMNNQHDIIDDRIDVVTRGLLGLTMTCARCHDHKFDPISTKDYYSLYGVFASCNEPTVPPLYDPPPNDGRYDLFAMEMSIREDRLRDFVRRKHTELVEGAKKRAAEYMLAAHASRGRPAMDEFMLIADGADLNPQMIVRWQAYLERTRKRGDSVFALWHQLAELPEADFAVRAAELLKRLDDIAVHPRIRVAFRGEAPKSMADVAKRYSIVLNAIESLTTRADAMSIVVGAAVIQAQIVDIEALRQVFRGADSPASVTVSDVGDLALLPDRPSQGELQKLRREVEQWRANGPAAPPRAMAMNDAPTLFEPRVFLRGNPFNLGDAVPRQLPAVLASKARTPFATGSGRLELARAIASRGNPLTARVIVNRVWLQHFGRGLVTTPSDFGLRSDAPSHPELLDHLAKWFMDNGWSLKKLHKQILMSATYRQRSDDRPECRKVDPENVLLWRASRRRHDFEATRDSLLSVSGKLDRNVGGASFNGLFNSTRRTLYAHLDRLNVPGIYRTFDFPSPDATSPKRDETTVPPQALFMMNHPFVADAAKNVLNRPDVQREHDQAARIERVYQVLFGRLPTGSERAIGAEYLGSKPSLDDWARYVHALLVTNEFGFVD